MEENKERNIVWKPQPRQLEFMRRPEPEALYGGAAASVTRSKQHKLLQTARLWLARHNGSFDTVDCRFDVVAFTGNEVEWIKDAFNDHS